MHKRPSCPRCFRPVKTCLCKHVNVVQNLIPLVILQHHLEVHETKNSGRLLHLCLKNSQIHSGEDFTSLSTEMLSNDDYVDILLYPETPEDKAMGLEIPPTLIERKNELKQTNKWRPRLWVIDATWRKSRKVLYLNRFLQRMPRLSLNECKASIYTIRKAHSENQLSTLEASCYALQQLEEQQVDYTPVIESFAAFVADQKTFLPNS